MLLSLLFTLASGLVPDVNAEKVLKLEATAFGQSMRKSHANGGEKKKGKTKDPEQDLDMSEHQIRARIDKLQSKLAVIMAAKTPATGARAQALQHAPRSPPTALWRCQSAAHARLSP